jgi:hypothetical protein
MSSLSGRAGVLSLIFAWEYYKVLDEIVNPSASRFLRDKRSSFDTPPCHREAGAKPRDAADVLLMGILRVEELTILFIFYRSFIIMKNRLKKEDRNEYCERKRGIYQCDKRIARRCIRRDKRFHGIYYSA